MTENTTENTGVQPLDLADDDFDLDAPPGFRSRSARQKLQGIAAAVAIVGILLQTALPQIVMFACMPDMYNPSKAILSRPQIAHAVAWDNQLWFPITQFGGGRTSVSLRAGTWQGEWVKDSDLALPFPADHYVAEGKVLWGVSALGSVMRIEDRQITTHHPLRKLQSASSPFIHAGELHVVERQINGIWMLQVFQDQQWTPKGAFRLPAEFLESTISQPANRWTPISERMQVVQDGDQLWTVFGDGATIWRIAGLPLTPVDQIQVAPLGGIASPASALLVDNAPEAQWDSFQASLSEWAAATTDREIVVASTSPIAGLGQTTIAVIWPHDGPARGVQLPKLPPTNESTLVTTEDGTLHFITETFPPGGAITFNWTSTAFLQEMRLSSPSQMMSLSFENLGLYALLWSIPTVVTLVVFVVLMKVMGAFRDRRYQFAHLTVRLATLGRRAAARLIDTIIFTSPSIPLTFAVLKDVTDPAWMERTMADPLQMLKTLGITILISMVYLFVVTILLAVMEGWWGITPGKWMCGLRVVRTTLQPIGILRGVARQLLLMIDGMFNYMVGMLLIALLARQQRLGDLAADSIVIEAASLTPSQESMPPQLATS